MKNIDVPDDVYRRLQEHGRAFEDTPADVISRALDALDAGGRSVSHIGEPEWRRTLHELVGSQDLVSHAGRVPNGTQLRAYYKGKEYLAEVIAGAVFWNGQQYESLSKAAVAVIQSTGSRRATENGWRFWEYYDEANSEWHTLNEWRAA